MLVLEGHAAKYTSLTTPEHKKLKITGKQKAPVVQLLFPLEKGWGDSRANWK